MPSFAKRVETRLRSTGREQELFEHQVEQGQESEQEQEQMLELEEDLKEQQKEH